MKKYAILVESEEMFNRDYKRFKNAYDKHSYATIGEWTICEEFDSYDEAIEFFDDIKPSYRSLSCAIGDYKIGDIYELVERYPDGYGEFYDICIKYKSFDDEKTNH